MKAKRIVSIIMVLALSLALLVVPVGAAEITLPTVARITVNNAVVGETYSFYRLFNLTFEEPLVDGRYTEKYALNPAYDEFFQETFKIANPGKAGGFLEKTAWDDIETAIAELEQHKDNSVWMQEFGRLFKNWLLANPTVSKNPDARQKAADTSFVVNGIFPGYYAMVSDNGTGTEINVVSTNVPTLDGDKTFATATIEPKDEVPDIEKKQVTEDEDGDEVESETGTATVGDDIDYKVNFDLPDMVNYKSFWLYVTDQLSNGLTFNDDVVVTMDGTTLVESALTADQWEDPDADYWVEFTPATGKGAKVIVYFTKAFYEKNKNFYYKLDGGALDLDDDGKPTLDTAKALLGKIEVRYSAKLNEDAVVGEVGNPNSVTLTYSNDPNSDYDGDPRDPVDPPPTITTPPEVTITYTFTLTLEKVKDDGTTPLEGAKFSLWTDNGEMADTAYQLKGGVKETKTGPDGKTIYLLKNPVTERIVKENGVTTAVYHDFKAVGDGRYYIYEEESPLGYKVLEKPIVFEVETKTKDEVADANDHGLEWVKIWKIDIAEDGTETKTLFAEVTAGYFDENGTWVDGKQGSEGGHFVIDIDDLQDLENIKVKVKNEKSTIPNTGGMGKTMLTIGGILIMALALVAFFVWKRKNKGQAAA